MKFQKKVLAELERCYSASAFEIRGEQNLICASEGKQPCYRFRGEDFSIRETIWEEPGGTMSIVAIPGKKDAFLAIQKFFRLYQWEEAQIVWVQMEADGHFSSKVVFQRAYIHRFDLIEKNGICYFVGCTLSAHKKERDDWSCPGAVYTAVLNKDTKELEQMAVLRADVYKNHGYWRGGTAEEPCAYFGCEQGSWRLVPPEQRGQPWQQEKIFDAPVSDMAFCDIDADGEEEMAVIAPFHGEYFRIYKRREGNWHLVYTNPEITPFYHVVWGGILAGKPTFIGGCRRGRQQLFAVYWDAKGASFVTEIIDEGVGPSNVAVLHEENHDVLLSANREKAEIAAYFFDK